MNKRIIAFVILVITVCALTFSLAACNTQLGFDEGVSELLQAIQTSSEARTWYTKYDVKNDGVTTTYKLNVARGNEKLEWDEFILAKFDTEVKTSAETKRTSVTFGHSLRSGADTKNPAREDYRLSYFYTGADSKTHVADMTEQEFFAMDAIAPYTLENLLSGMKGITAEDIEPVDSVPFAVKSGVVITLSFRITDPSFAYSAYNGDDYLVVRITSGRISKISSAKGGLNISINYQGPNIKLGNYDSKDYIHD